MFYEEKKQVNLPHGKSAHRQSRSVYVHKVRETNCWEEPVSKACQPSSSKFQDGSMYYLWTGMHLNFILLSISICIYVSIYQQIAYLSVIRNAQVKRFFLPSFCLFVSCLSIHFFPSLSIYLTIDPSIYHSIYSYVYPSIYHFIDPSINPSIYPSIYSSIYSSIYQSIFSSIYPSVYLSIYHLIYPSIYLPVICI